MCKSVWKIPFQVCERSRYQPKHSAPQKRCFNKKNQYGRCETATEPLSKNFPTCQTSYSISRLKVKPEWKVLLSGLPPYPTCRSTCCLVASAWELDISDIHPDCSISFSLAPGISEYFIKGRTLQLRTGRGHASDMSVFLRTVKFFTPVFTLFQSGH